MAEEQTSPEEEPEKPDEERPVEEETERAVGPSVVHVPIP